MIYLQEKDTETLLLKVLNIVKTCPEQMSKEHKNLDIFAYVIMSNHVHIIARSSSENLSQTIGDIKKFTSKRIIKSISEESESRKEWLLFMFERAAKKHKRNKTYQLWTHEPRRAQRS